MLKMVFLVRRKPDMDADAFRAYWSKTHAPIAAKLPGLRRYVQNHAISGDADTSVPYDGLAEMWWDDEDAMQQSLASPQGQAAQADVEKFMDLSRMQVLRVEQIDIV